MWYAYKDVGKTFIHTKLKNSDRHFKMYLENIVKIEKKKRSEWSGVHSRREVELDIPWPVQDSPLATSKPISPHCCLLGREHCMKLPNKYKDYYAGGEGGGRRRGRGKGRHC